MKGAEQLIAQMVYPDMTMKTYTALAPLTSPLDVHKLLLGCDPQTSGGLLVAVDPAFADEFRASARALNLPVFVIEPIGRIIAPTNHLISMV
jgi:selenide,water dikinase